jgi:hypothetical protein
VSAWTGVLLGSPPLYRVYTFTYANHFFLCNILSIPHILLPRRAPRSLKELLPWEWGPPLSRGELTYVMSEIIEIYKNKIRIPLKIIN